MRYDLICFDLDGRLVDTASEIAEAANRALEGYGIDRRPSAEITHLIGAGKIVSETWQIDRKLVVAAAAD